MAARRPVLVEPNATLRHACEVLSAEGIDAVLVQQPGHTVALVTAGDIATALAEGADPDVVWVADVAGGHPAHVLAGDTVRHAVGTVVASGVNHAIVLDADGLVGTVSLRDLVAALLPDDRISALTGCREGSADG